jgi:hypothetical protein
MIELEDHRAGGPGLVPPGRDRHLLALRAQEATHSHLYHQLQGQTRSAELFSLYFWRSLIRCNNTDSRVGQGTPEETSILWPKVPLHSQT